MSWLPCSNCGAPIDTDADPGAWVREDERPDGSRRDIWMCERCREELEEHELEIVL